MIIRYPTGLYSRQIPTSPSDVGNVTFVVSNEVPSELPGNFILFPVAESSKKLPPKAYTDAERRIRLGDLIYTITKGGVSSNGTNTKLFEVGQMLEFSDDQTSNVNLDTVPQRLELQHNTNLLDLKSLGLNELEILAIENQSSAIETQIEAQLTDIQNQIADCKITIVNLQKTINEATKTISALNVIGASDEVKAKVTKILNDSTTEQNVKIEELNDLIEQSQQLTDKLFAVSQLVR